MHPFIPRSTSFGVVARVLRPRARVAIVLIAGTLGISTAFAQASSPQVPGSANPPKHHAKKSTAVPVAQAAPTPPPPPDWPVNDQPAAATVSWDKQVLKIDAANSSLQQILSQVTSQTGAKMEGLGQDERVFGDYGPGPARDVLSQLLQGTGYNVMLAGDMGDGVPREIVLSQRHGGAGNGAAQMSRTQQEEMDDISGENEVDTQPQPPPVVQPPNPGFAPGNQGPARTPQQLMQELQQRQLQIQQQQQSGQPPNNPQQ